MKKPRRADLIGGISDERANGDGYWIYLAKGFCADGWEGKHHSEAACVHCVHEETPKEARAELKYVVPCDCERCKGGQS